MRVIFTCLGPDKKYVVEDGKEYIDGDSPNLSDKDYENAVFITRFAQEYTEDLEIRTKRLIESAHKKRNEVLLKMKNIKR
jgi:hypothetical protein